MAPAAATRRPRRIHRGGGFTLIELMVVIGIIVLLAAILLPVVSKVRTNAYDVSTQSQMQRIMQACQQYFHDFNAYPGPVPNAQLVGAPNPPSVALSIPWQNGGTPVTTLTSSENLVLGLFGFLNPPAAVGGSPMLNDTSANPGVLVTPPHDVLNLNPLRPAKYTYLDYVANELSPGNTSKLESMAGAMPSDSVIPEFIDRFPDAMPILYMRANVGTSAVISTSAALGQYDANELSPYACNIRLTTGVDPEVLSYTSSTNNYMAKLNSDMLDGELAKPFIDYDGTTTSGNYDGWLSNPNIAGAAKGKDGFVLIAPGKDRTYGTHDDTIVTP